MSENTLCSGAVGRLHYCQELCIKPWVQIPVQCFKIEKLCFTFHNKPTQSHARDCFLSKSFKKEKKNPTVLQSPRALFIVEYHNPVPSAVEAGGTQRIQKYSKWQKFPMLFAAWNVQLVSLSAVAAVFFLAASRPGIDVRSSILV